MKRDNLEDTANALVADGKGILAADETPNTLTKRFDVLKIAATARQPASLSRNVLHHAGRRAVH